MSSNSSGGSGGVVFIFWFAIGSICSYIINHSVMWAIFHGLFAGFYLIYLCMGNGFGPVDEALNRVTQGTIMAAEQSEYQSESENAE
jgi:hypothetical protein